MIQLLLGYKWRLFFQDHGAQFRLKPASPPDPKRIQQLIADLDSDNFADREAASGQLENIVGEAEPALKKALEGKPSAEVRRRIEVLLSAPGIIKSPETLRNIRAIQVLEQIGSKEAKVALEALAKGAPLARETQDAKAALDRLGNRAVGNP